MNSARALLAIFFPPSLGLNGAETRISDLCTPSHRQPHWAPRREAAQTIIKANFERPLPGLGNRARRRLASLGIVKTDRGVGRLLVDGALQLANRQVVVSPKPVVERVATFMEVARFFEVRASVDAEMTAYYETHDFTGD